MAAPLAQKLNRIQQILQIHRSSAIAGLNTYNRFSSIQRQRVTAAPQNRPTQQGLNNTQWLQSSRFHSTQSEQPDTEDESDVLYRQIVIEVKGHDKGVLGSYQRFVRRAAQELDIKLHYFRVPRMHIDRRSVLRSAFIYKKHFSQYEIRTHFNEYTFKYLTGSTADTFLEYLQRNLPEGVAMKVTRYRLEKFPEHLQEHMKKHSKTES